MSAEHAARVDADRAVDPDRLGHWRVAVDDGGVASVVLRPRVADGQPEVVGLARRVAVERERPDDARRPPMHRGGQTRVRHDQLSVVEHVVPDERVEEPDQLGGELLRLELELLEALGKSVARRDLSPLERPEQLRPAVDEVTEEDCPATLRVRRGRSVLRELVAEHREECDELVEAAVDVPDEIEGSVVVSTVVPDSLALEGGSLDLRDAREQGNAVEPFLAEPPHGPPHLVELAADDVSAEGPVRSNLVAGEAHLDRHVEHDGDCEHVVRLRKCHELAPRLDLHVGRIDDREPARSETLARDVVQDVECVVGRGLVILVVTHESPAEVRGEDFGRQEMLSCEGGLARAARPDQHDQRQLWDLDGHRRNTAICVGVPTSSSSGPMPANSTA